MNWICLTAAPLWLMPGMAPVPDTLLGPLHVVPPANGPAVVVREQPGMALVAVRLSVPVEEPPALTGAVDVLQRLARGRAEVRAARHGARIQFHRTPTHAVYAAVGPAREFAELVSIVRRAVEAPALTPGRLEAVRLEIEAEALAELETPARLLRHRLRTLLFPELTQPAAGVTAVRAITPDRLRNFWSRNFHPQRMHAVVVGAVSRETAASAFRGWTVPEAVPAAEFGTEPPPPAAETQVIFRWGGVGYAARAGTDAAALAVATALVQARLTASALRHATAELWWTGDERALVVMAAEPPGGVDAGATSSTNATVALTQRLRTLVAETAALLEQGQVIDARRRLRREFLFSARTPQGLAELVGQFLDRTGDPGAAGAFLEALAAVEITAVRAALLDLLLAEAVNVEIGP